MTRLVRTSNIRKHISEIVVVIGKFKKLLVILTWFLLLNVFLEFQSNKVNHGAYYVEPMWFIIWILNWNYQYHNIHGKIFHFDAINFLTQCKFSRNCSSLRNFGCTIYPLIALKNKIELDYFQKYCFIWYIIDVNFHWNFKSTKFEINVNRNISINEYKSLKKFI